jgi:hypothetical protein
MAFLPRSPASKTAGKEHFKANSMTPMALANATTALCPNPP